MPGGLLQVPLQAKWELAGIKITAIMIARHVTHLVEREVFRARGSDDAAIRHYLFHHEPG